MRYLARFLYLVVVLFLLIAIGKAAGPAVAEEYRPAVSSQGDMDYFVYLPLVQKAPNACEPIPGVNYLSLSVVDRYDPQKPPPENNPDYRILLLGYNPVNQAKGLVYYGPSNDPNTPPQFTTLFASPWTLTILNTYQANGWDWDNHRPIPTPWTDPPVSVIGIQTTPKAIVRVPDSSYVIGTDCGDGGCDALVLYASQSEITLRYAREDDVYPGYTVHIAGICVEPTLLSRYQQNHEAGARLPPRRAGRPAHRAGLGHRDRCRHPG
jgi:hypothetical protein